MVPAAVTEMLLLVGSVGSSELTAMIPSLPDVMESPAEVIETVILPTPSLNAPMP